MLILLFFSILSVDEIDTIRQQILNGQYDEAYQASNSMIVQQGTNNADQILFFFRGYSNIKLGNYLQGISDLSHFLNISKDIDFQDQKDAYILRGTAYLKIGDLNKASTDAVVSRDEVLLSLVRQAASLLNSAKSNETSPQLTLNTYSKLIEICPLSEDFLCEAANISIQLNNITLFKELSKKVFKISPSDAKMRQMKSKFLFSNGNIEKAKNCINKCVNSKECTEFFNDIQNFELNRQNTIKSIEINDIESAEKSLNYCQEIVKKYSHDKSPLSNSIKEIQVKILSLKNKSIDAVYIYEDLIESNPNNENYVIQQGQLLVDIGDFKGAIDDFQKVKKNAKNESPEFFKADELIKKVESLQEEEKKSIYSDLLDVKNDASKDFKKTYKEMTMKWHPDRFKDPINKRIAERKMAIINSAYDSLCNQQNSSNNNNDINNMNPFLILLVLIGYYVCQAFNFIFNFFYYVLCFFVGLIAIICQSIASFFN